MDHQKASEENPETPAKIIKLSDPVGSVDSLSSFEGFAFKRILKEIPESRLVAVEGSFGDHPAVVVLEKTQFTESDVRGIVSESTSLQLLFQNDIYGSFHCHPLPSLNAVKATVIHPATEKHIEKWSSREAHLIEETPEIYELVTLPHIIQSQFDIQVVTWVLNILEHKKEAERIVFEDQDPDSGFILLPDLKWDCKSNNNLYLTGIPYRRGIKSLRDLTAEHLPLLKKLLLRGSAAISEKYGLPRSQQRIYIHYQPSYYHLHVHFTSLQYTPPGCSVERAHLLTSVIRNIELQADYYQKAVLTSLAFEGDNLLMKYRQHVAQHGEC